MQCHQSLLTTFIVTQLRNGSVGHCAVTNQKGVRSEKRQQTKPGGLLSEQHLYYVCQAELPLSLWLTV